MRYQVGTYNVAGGNEHFSENFNDRTSNELARRIQSGAVDVVALQEVAVGNENAKGRDYNVEILRDVFAHASSVDSGTTSITEIARPTG